MKTFLSAVGRLMPLALGLVALSAFGLAFADATSASPAIAGTPTQVQLPLAAMITMALGSMAGWAMRKYSTVEFFHTAAGAVVQSFVTALATALVGIGQTGLVSVQIIGLAVFGALMTALNMNNPSMAGKPTDPAATSKLAMLLLPLLMFGLVGCPAGAGKAYGLRYATCMEGKGETALAGVEQKVGDVMQNGATKDQVVGDLEQVGETAGVDAVICAVQAWLGDHPLPAGAAASPRLLVAHAGGLAFLANHGVAQRLEHR